MNEYEGGDFDVRLGARILREREARGWSLTELAERSQVSRAQINKVERGASSPTAAVLGKLSAAFGLTISTLLGGVEGEEAVRLTRFAEHPQWMDPATGYVRRQIAPHAGSSLTFEITHVELPAGESTSYPASAFAFLQQLVFVLDGQLAFTEGDTVHRLGAGDSLELGSSADCTFANASGVTCTYLVVVARK
ncbi:helix-turn-helix domain-containing protein [Gulosibacter chungangensis]|uniref:Helix-turn-helix domain-containing protein n=1 Tax=Gulosibacter chungangensis TaxID=979746 RepID=A0A7J5BDE8_9MICO|nr:helix-turn-helix domain-containing protein [Gulosibacter chungangensis]